MTQLEECRKAVEQICIRQNDCWYDTKTIATAVYVILTHMIDADRKTEPQYILREPTDEEMQAILDCVEDEPQTERSE